MDIKRLEKFLDGRALEVVNGRLCWSFEETLKHFTPEEETEFNACLAAEVLYEGDPTDE